MIVVAGIPQEQNRCLWIDVFPVTLPKNFKRMAVVTVPINPHHVSFGVHAVNRVADVDIRFEVVSHFVNSVNEYE